MTEPLLTAQAISKRFGARPGAEDISLALEAGLMHAVVGPAKSGKSTIAGLVAGTVLPDEGTITFRGSAIQGKTAGERARMGIALVAGSDGIFAGETVLDNVRIAREAVRRRAGSDFGPRSEVTELAAWRALIATHLKTHAQLRAGSLGFIDRRWLQIAMALVGEPEVLVLDEPFAGADPGDVKELGEFLDRLKRRHAILLTDRSIERVTPWAGKISLLAHGRVVVTASPQEIDGPFAAAGGAGNA